MLAPTDLRRRAAARERQRRWRRRVRAGHMVLRIEVDKLELAEAATEALGLPPREAVEREKLEGVVQDLVQSWISHWRLR